VYYDAFTGTARTAGWDTPPFVRSRAPQYAICENAMDCRRRRGYAAELKRIRILIVCLDAVVAGGLPSIDMENLACHKPRPIEVKHRIDYVGDVSHPAQGVECG